jgi:predicted O-methyltransferase YrrM
MSKIRITENLKLLKNYLNHFIKSSHRHGHGIHSPFVYDFVANVLFDKKYYPEYDFFRNIRKELMDFDICLDVNEIGAGSKKIQQKTRLVSEMVKVSSVNEKFGRLFFRLAHYYNPLSILELGTSVGLSTIYLSKGAESSKVYTIEGNKSLCDYAKTLFIKKDLKNIEVIEGLFDDKLKTVIPLLTGSPLIFIDGNHSFEPTLGYYRLLSDNLDEYILIFDDISWSEGMQKAWAEIVFNSKKDVTIDLFRMGIIIRKKDVTPGFYRILI